MKKIIAAVSTVMLAATLATTALAAEKRIMVYGDSIAFGWAKDAQGTVYRFPENVRWPENMGSILGKDYKVIVEALGGRTTNIDVGPVAGSGIIPGVGMNGASYLPAALSSHMPLDLVVISLGTNDMMVQHNRKALDVMTGISQLVAIVQNAGWQKRTAYPVPKVLVICPTSVDAKKGKNVARFKGAKDTVAYLQKALPSFAKANGVYYFDANSVVPLGEAADELHYSEANHVAFAKAMAKKVKEVLKK